MAERYQSSGKKSTKKFEVMGRKEVAVRLPLPVVEVWEELQPEVEHLTGLAGLKIIRAVIEDEVMRRVGPRHQPDPASSCLRWGQQSGYVVFAGQKAAVHRPRCARAKAKKFSWTVTRGCNTAGGGSARCAKGSWPG
jgi:hypothetical protein